MTELELARQHIDEADRELAKWFSLRMDAVREVAAYKKEHDLPIENLARESEIIERNSALVCEEYRPYFRRFLQNNMDLSKEFQQKLI